MTRTTWMASALLVVALGCKKEAAPAAETPPPPSPSMAEAPKPPEPAKSQAAAGDALARRYLECWGFFDAKDWASFQT